MSKAIDLTGQVFGNLTVVSCVGSCKSGGLRWLCECSCGKTTVVASGNLRRGNVKSCGCAKGIKGAISKLPNERHTNRNRLYNTWQHMHARCEKPTTAHYDIYGGRGITVCPEWSGQGGFDCFREWALSHGYADDLEIDRIDVNGNYEPNNCRFATVSINRSNKRPRGKSGTTGVYFKTASKKWVAKITINGKCKHLGYFDNKEDAITARKKAEAEYWQK